MDAVTQVTQHGDECSISWNRPNTGPALREGAQLTAKKRSFPATHRLLPRLLTRPEADLDISLADAVRDLQMPAVVTAVF
jgi:hypothetical protein